MRRTYTLRIGFLAVLGLLGLVLLGVVLLMALPRPKYELLGPIETYPAKQEPYDLRAIKGYFLVNSGDEIFAINPDAPRRAGCRVYWDAERNRFSDPCFGTVFDLRGEYLNGPPSKALGRYPVRIEDQSIWVSMNQIR